MQLEKDQYYFELLMLNKSTLYCHNIKVVLCLILTTKRNGVLLVVSLEMFSGHIKILSLYSITLYKESQNYL